MSTPLRRDYSFTAGDDETISFLVTDKNKAIVDLTGGSSRLHVRLKSEDPTPKLALVGVIDGAAGKVTYDFTPLETADLNTDNKGAITYVYDIELTYPSGKVKTPVSGRITTAADVTR